MPKSKPSRRGGARAGAGRPPKGTIRTKIKKVMPAEVRSAVERIKNSNAGIASGMAETAYQTLDEVMKDKTQPAASRVTAARAIIDLAKAEQASANEPTGKKASVQAAARTVSSAPTDGWGDDLMLPGARTN